jgi:hypothetical protein
MAMTRRWKSDRLRRWIGVRLDFVLCFYGVCVYFHVMT